MNKKCPQISLEGEVDSNTIIVGDFNIHFHQWIDHPNRKSIRKHFLKWHVRPDGLNRHILLSKNQQICKLTIIIQGCFKNNKRGMSFTGKIYRGEIWLACTGARRVVELHAWENILKSQRKLQ